VDDGAYNDGELCALLPSTLPRWWDTMVHRCDFGEEMVGRDRWLLGARRPKQNQTTSTSCKAGV
jgi:hypothetical protein